MQEIDFLYNLRGTMNRSPNLLFAARTALLHGVASRKWHCRRNHLMAEHFSLSLDRRLMGGNTSSDSGDGEDEGEGANSKFHGGKPFWKDLEK
jgi:hypothetical protein